MKKTFTKHNLLKLLSLMLLLGICCGVYAQKPKFRVIAFYTGKADLAHISFVHEANKRFPELAAKYNFSYDSTNNWDNMNAKYLAQYQVILFLDTRPEKPEQRAAFEAFMKSGGSWAGFHFAAFALTPSAVQQNWDWYHNEFLGSGQYVSNTWRPTSAILRIEDKKHPVAKGMPATFKASPNEWYRWEKDLTKNPDISIICAIDSTSFPLGTGPKQHEIWHSGHYPVVWANKKYNMVYFNMGHNDMDYEHKYDNTNKTLSSTFGSEMEEKLIVNTLLWLGSKKKTN
ncbi:ThuA domain-containing protein [Mucilaginibacter mali]|uniref:ThuA domain-containing protein n=1 Tax=Mucilaginibacter mali TaxID=2740462 RepID=A0A7D4PTR1_9SPHI|nr:ThuA domain-containing protein [Mucilaginibacter mali]QKJ29903.1 ThuA domain-containing protein [Mucilaginibacter mali]